MVGDIVPSRLQRMPERVASQYFDAGGCCSFEMGQFLISISHAIYSEATYI